MLTICAVLVVWFAVAAVVALGFARMAGSTQEGDA